MISVIMPSYNAAKYIAGAVQSILDQSYGNFELIIVDDCSTDGTTQIVRSFTDSRITVISNEKNSGPAVTMNHGISVSNGNYIAVMHADDIAVADRLANQLSFLDSNDDIDVVGTQYAVIDENDQLTGEVSTLPLDPEEIKFSLFFTNTFCHPSVMMRRRVFDSGMAYNIDYRLCEDYELWISLALKGYKMANLNSCCLQYRKHSSQASTRFSVKESEVFNSIRDKYRTGYFNLPFEQIEIIEPGKVVAVAKTISKNCSSETGKRILFANLVMNLHRLLKSGATRIDFSWMEYFKLVRIAGMEALRLPLIYQMIRKK